MPESAGSSRGIGAERGNDRNISHAVASIENSPGGLPGEDEHSGSVRRVMIMAASLAGSQESNPGGVRDHCQQSPTPASNATWRYRNGGG